MEHKVGKNVVIAFLIVSILIMAAGYALLSSQLKISGTAGVTSKWDVAITAITEGTATGSAINKAPATYTGTTATFDVELQKPGDSMTYDITISNNGSLNAVLDSIMISPDVSGSEAIIYSVTGVTEGTKLEVGSTNTVTVKVEWDNQFTSMPQKTSKELTVILNYVQKDWFFVK